MIQRILIVWVSLLSMAYQCKAQGENNIWYLGIPLGIDFNKDTPTIIPMHAYGAYGGGASVSDAAGNLLFYTNGGGIFNAQHQLMPGTANFSDFRTGGLATLHMPDTSRTFINFNKSDIKIVQLDSTKPRYHVFYMLLPDRKSDTNNYWIGAGLGFAPDERLTQLAYSIVDMQLNNGAGGIDPNFRNVVVDSQLTRHFDIWSDGQCGVWIVVNKKNVAYPPKSAAQDHGHLLSYLLQPNGNIVLAHSQAEYYELSNYNSISFFYPHVQIRFAENGQNLIMQYEKDDRSGYHSYGNYFNKAIVRRFDSKTGSSLEVIDTIAINNLDQANQPIPENDLYFTANGQWIYSLDDYDSIFAYPAQYLGNFAAMQQNKLAVSLNSLTLDKMGLTTADSFRIQKSNTKIRKGPDEKLYFFYRVLHNGPGVMNQQKFERQFYVLARIPDPALPISTQNFEIVDTHKIYNAFSIFRNNMAAHLNEQHLRSGKSAFFYFTGPGVNLGQIGKNATIYRYQAAAAPIMDTVLCQQQGFMAYAPYPQYDNVWSPGNVASDSLYINTPGTYTLTTTAPHCTFTQHYEVKPAPDVSLSIVQQDTIICTQAPITLEAVVQGPVTNLRWNTGATTITLPNVIASGTYHVAGDGPCGTLSDSVHIEAKDCSCLHFVPNAFTPNNDGLNDKLYTYLHCSPHHYRFWVYDRWGKMVWFSDKVTEHWDGSQKGKPCDVGVYFYYMQYRDPLNQLQEHRGEVHLMR